jgi:hypothetical protein
MAIQWQVDGLAATVLSATLDGGYRRGQREEENDEFRCSEGTWLFDRMGMRYFYSTFARLLR